MSDKKIANHFCYDKQVVQTQLEQLPWATWLSV